MHRCLVRAHSKLLSSTISNNRSRYDLGFFKGLLQGHGPSSHQPQRSFCRTARRTGLSTPNLRPRWFDISSPSPDPTRDRPVTPGKIEYPSNSDVDAWLVLVDQHLPREFRLSTSGSLKADLDNGSSSKDVLKTLTLARANAGVDLLEHMVLEQGRHRAARHLVYLLLEPLAGSANNHQADQLPSNIQWPVSFDEPYFRRTSSPAIELDSSSYLPSRTLTPWVEPFVDGGSDLGAEKIMQFILPLLANLVVAASQRSEADAAVIMRTVSEILARMHHLGLTPPNVYDHSLPNGTTYTPRPPILHLLSSRILSALSDAVLRSRQEESFEQAVREGMSYKQISREVFGGGYRVRLRELGHEVWLEFLLWCCVDGGYASAGVRIINILREQTTHPWYAVHWCSDLNPDGSVPVVDWDKVKRRLGGIVGPGEGTSREEPFMHIPKQTISAEVVLALIECLFNSINTGVRGSGLSIRKFQTYILDLVFFLEPHCLSPEYFNYLTVRMLQTGSIYIEEQPEALKDWYTVISQMRSLQTIKPQPERKVSLDLETVASQSELQSALLHQSLQAYINRGNATQAVNVFTEIQHCVDSSKLNSIDSFLGLAPTSASVPTPFHTNTTSRLDFVDSHGQLPMFRMAAFLNLVSNAQLFGLGDWLFGSADVDGPLIPSSVFSELCMTVAVAKYADAAEDDDLLHQVIRARSTLSSKPSVNVLRAFTNASIRMSDWPSSRSLLEALREVPGGGYSPRIVARLAAKILRIESQGRRLNQDGDLEQACTLMSDILVGNFDGPHADFTFAVKRTFGLQIGYLLRMFENLPSPAQDRSSFIWTNKLKDLAYLFKPKFPTSNEANLAPETFNDVLAAIVEVRGAAEGVRMWNMFCKDPRTSVSSENVPLLGEYVVPARGIVDNDEEIFYVLRSADQMPELIDGYIPIVSTGYEDVLDIPIQGEPINSNKDNARPGFNPIVVPNITTLHIIVRGVIAEKRQLQGIMTQKLGALDKVLAWAAHFYRAFGSSRHEVEAETQLPIELKGEAQSQAQLKWHYDRSRRQSGDREKSPPKVQAQFTNYSRLTRLPGVGRTVNPD